MVRKYNVALLMGGPSREHNVSLESGKMVINHIDYEKYNLFPIIINRDGTWSVYDSSAVAHTPIFESDPSQWQAYPQTLSLPNALSHIKQMDVDIFFNVMHGAYGEDGTIQGVLEAYNMPYTGSNVLASSLAMDKILYKQFLTGAGVCVPDSIFITPTDMRDISSFVDEITGRLGFPCVIKTPSSGSSIGVELCRNSKELMDTAKKLLPIDNRLVIERFIEGREFTCAVLGNANTRDILALPPTEIISKNPFFDFEAKYTPDKAEEITPAQINQSLTQALRKIAITVHNLLGCNGLSRTDMLWDNENIFVLETNTIPGMTANSLLPKAALAYGMTLTQLIDNIIQYGLGYYHTKQNRLRSLQNF